MKKSVFLLLLIISLPFCYATETQIPETFTSDTTQVTSYFYTGEKLLASKENNQIQYYHLDRLGSNRLTTSSSGIKTGEFKSLPFGEENLNTNNEKFTFTGKELDSELYYFGARYYDSSTGRFTSVDPVKENNVYVYVNNNPMNLIDLNGKEFDDPVLMAEGFKDNKPANFVMDFIPILGDAKCIGEGIVGYNSLGEKLAWWERGINFLGIGEFKAPTLALAAIIPAVPSSFIEKFPTIIFSKQVARRIDNMPEQEVEALEKTIQEKLIEPFGEKKLPVEQHLRLDKGARLLFVTSYEKGKIFIYHLMFKSEHPKVNQWNKEVPKPPVNWEEPVR